MTIACAWWIALPVALLAVGVERSARATDTGSSPNAAAGAIPAFVPNEVIVQFRHGVPPARRALALRHAGISSHRPIGAPDDGLVLVTTTLQVAGAIAILSRSTDVQFAEPNWVVRRAATSDDPSYVDGSLWGMYGDGTTPANEFGSQAGELWGRGFTGSRDVVVGVIDEGIDIGHPDLAENIWVNPFDPVDGIDNDSNGFVDDVNGWDFVNHDNSLYDGNAANPAIDAHGTHVAGIIGARGGNAVGVAGVNWNVTIVGAKVIGGGGTATTDATIAAIRYLTDLKVRHGLPVTALNNSWSGSGYSQALHQAIIRAAKQDILFVAAAGDGGFDGVGDDNDAIPDYPSGYATNVGAGVELPASYDAVVAVTAITREGSLASFANYGPASVDIGAPGSDIVSTTPQNGYGSLSGTSMAAPHVTGALAVYASMNPGASAAQRRGAVLSHGISTPSLAGRTVSARRLNAGDFIQGSLPSLSVGNVTLMEGDSGTTNAVFTVSLSTAATSRVTVNYEAVSGTASGGSYAHSAPIGIPSGGSATPYPATITVPSGRPGTITRLAVVLRGFRHDYPSDVDVLLVGPQGQTCLLLSDVGGGSAVSGVTLTFDDTGTRLDQEALVTGTYQPSNAGTQDVFPDPAPSGPYGTTLAAFNGTSPEGSWRLFVVDDLTGFGGSIEGGWSLVMTTTLADFAGTSGTLIYPPGTTARTVPVPVIGDTMFELTESFTLALSNAVGATIAIGGGSGTIKNDDFTDHPLLPGTVVKAAHIRELRAMVTEARAARGLPRFEFSDPTLTAQSTVARALHITELRAALAEVCPPPAYTDPVLRPGVTPIRAAHLMELRAAALACQ